MSDSTNMASSIFPASGFRQHASCWSNARSGASASTRYLSIQVQDGDFVTHRAILAANKWALECLANVRYLPPRGAVLFIGAPKVRNATGGPVRVVALAPQEPTFDSSRLDGEWKSAQPERVERVDGSIVYLIREFEFREGTWEIHFSVASDADGGDVMFSGNFGGRFELGQYTPLLDAFEARFYFAHRTLTPGNEQIAVALNDAGCGQEPWQEGIAQDVHDEGCVSFRVYPFSDCDGEYDIAAPSGDRLLLGTRPAAGNLCSDSNRPIELTHHALIRQE